MAVEFTCLALMATTLVVCIVPTRPNTKAAMTAAKITVQADNRLSRVVYSHHKNDTDYWRYRFFILCVFHFNQSFLDGPDEPDNVSLVCFLHIGQTAKCLLLPL
jgi:hypothetical protein